MNFFYNSNSSLQKIREVQNFDLKVNKLFTKLMDKKTKKKIHKTLKKREREREKWRHNGIFLRDKWWGLGINFTNGPCNLTHNSNLILIILI